MISIGRRGRIFKKLFTPEGLCGRWARAEWLVWDFDNSTIMLRKASRDETLQKSLKFSDCRKSTRKQIRPSCRKTFRPHCVFVWFRECATKFRDSSEYSQCVQNVLAKSCLPCQIFFNWTKKKFCWVRKALGTSLDVRCYAGLVSSGFLCGCIKIWQQETKLKCSFFSVLYLLSPLSARLCAPCGMTLSHTTSVRLAPDMTCSL